MDERSPDIQQTIEVHPIVWFAATFLTLAFIIYSVIVHWSIMQTVGNGIWFALFVFLILYVIHRILVAVKYHHDSVHEAKMMKSERTIAGINEQKQLEKLEQEKSKSNQERAKAKAMELIPDMILYAMQNGHNVELTRTGDFKVSNYLSNIHALNAANEKTILAAPSIPVPPVHKFSETLENGFEPSPSGIYMGANTEDVVIPTGDQMCHVMMAAQTGGGKTNIERLMAIELLYASQKIIIVDPNYQDIRLMPNGERYDYRPIANKLLMPPVTDAEGAVQLMKELANEVLERQARKRHNIVMFSSIYVIIDELPFLAKFEKELMAALGIIVRIGRNYGVYVISAAQDVQNKTLESDEGSIRENFLTCLFGGGDMQSARVLLDLQKGEKLDEQGLGTKGLYYILARGIGYSKNRIRVPLADNEATYRLLGSRPTTSIYDLPVEQSTADFTFDAKNHIVEDETNFVSGDGGRYTDYASPETGETNFGTYEGRKQAVRERNGMRQGEIIFEIWGVHPGDSPSYREALSEYKRIKAELQLE